MISNSRKLQFVILESQFLNLILQGWPMIQPDVLVSTPGALLNYLCEYDREKRRRDQFLRRVKFVVYLSFSVNL